MNKYIDALIAKIAELRKELPDSIEHLNDEERGFARGQQYELTAIEEEILHIQQEQQKDKQVVVITESHGNANIEWDCRSLDDVMALLKSAESFISDKQVEKLRGLGCGPDYDTVEGRYSKLLRYQQKQPECSSSLIDVDAVREDFMTEVYRVLDADPTNDRANAIINAFDSLPTVSQEQPIKVYRVENEKEQKGLWRKFDGTWEPLFDMLSDGQCKDMPMEDSPIYREGGKQWFASAPSKETLQKWFSKKDLEELTAAGFAITEFEVLEYKKLSDFEFIFTRESIVNKTNINVTDIYPLK